MRYFTSDPHFNHKNIIKWGRPRFKTTEEHDKFLVNLYIDKWANKLTHEDELWVLGDWGNTDFLYIMSYFNCKTVFVYGNHDKHSDLDKFCHFFDMIYEYPIYLNDKICISHVPVAVFDDQINVYGHLHGNIIDKPNYVGVCLEVNDYNLVSEKYIHNRFSNMPKYNRKFLQAPYTEWEKVISRPENDLILKPNGHIDVSAQRAKLAIQEEMKNGSR